MSAKNKIINAFKGRSFVVYDNEDRPIDKEIEDFIYKINKCKGIITTNSCAGHSKEEKGSKENYNPYLAFLVNDMGWRIFWTLILPEISAAIPVIIWVIHEGNSNSIMLRGEDYSDKDKFWVAVKKSFINHFINQ